MIQNWKNKLFDMLGMVRTRDSFVQNAAYMFTASGLAILIQLVFFPVLSRLYTPEAYGLFGSFNFYAATIGGAVSLSYTQAFALERDEKKFTALLRLAILLATALCIFFTLATLICGKQVLALFDSEELGNWIYLVGPMGFFIAADRITMDWATRNKEFRKQTIWSTSSQLFAKSFNTVYGLLTSGVASGLFITNFVIFGAQSLSYLFIVLARPWKTLFAKVTGIELRTIAKEYKSFPAFIFPGNLVNTISNNFPSALLPATGFAFATVGYYNTAIILLDLPIRLLGSGVSSVFLPKAAEIVADRPHELKDVTWRLFKNMVALALLFSGGVFLLGEPVFSVYLGEQWRSAGRAAEVLSLYYFFRFISAPLAVLFNVLRKEREFFFFQAVLFVARLLSILVGALYTDDFITIMIFFSAANAVCYFFLTIRIIQLVKIPVIKMLVYTLSWALLVFGIAQALKTFVF